MTRTRVVVVAVGAAVLVALGVWIANNTYWAETNVPMPLKGEALTNPFYAAQRFTETLQARAAHDRIFAAPRHDAVIVLGSWRWSLSASRRERLERWVESGGRLVVDVSNAIGDEAFERWSGIVREYHEEEETVDEEGAESEEGESAVLESSVVEDCRPYREERDGVASDAPGRTRDMCHADPEYFLATTKPVAWALRDASGMQALRVRVGQGSVTVINTSPFRRRELFDGDHGWLFVAATQLRRGDDVHFLSEEEHPSLLAYIWAHGGPVIVLSLAVIAGLLWRGAVRFGPLAAATSTARRSLAEQIRGTGQFALRHGDGEALHAASVRALEEAARRRVKRYGTLPDGDRADTVARLTGLNAKALAAAMHRSSGRSQELRRAITRLETARRQILIEQNQRSSHGTR